MAYANFSQNDTKTNVQFYSGPQANLTTYITTGGAIEGAFYLTTDTQRLYVGRKDVDTGVVKAVQVSKGVTFVSSASDLPNPSSSDVEEGELYYLTSTNVLAALVYDTTATPAAWKWVQINPPTGIKSISSNASRPSSGNTKDVVINTTIATDAGQKKGQVNFVAGSNVSLTPNTATYFTEGNVTATAAVMTIAATDTRYKVGAEASTTAGVIGLISSTTTTFGTTLDATKITFVGTNTVAVTSSATANTVTIAGPTISAVTVNNHTTDGFQIGLSAKDGADNNLSITAAYLHPYIHYGNVSGSYAATAAFAAGIASLDVYTTAQTRSEIDNAIKEKLATADAMTYCGTIAPRSTTETLAYVLREKIIANGGAHNGDVYKIAGIDTSISQIDGVTPDVGDLLIITGTEETSGEFAGQILVDNEGVSGTPGSYTADTSKYTPNGLIALCELVPSGDEPEVQADLAPSNTNSQASSFQLRDGKNGATTNILTTTFQGIAPPGVSGSKILVTSADATTAVTSGRRLDVQIAHATTTRSDTSNAALTTATAADTIGTNNYKLFVMSSHSDLLTDAYGHVTGLVGKEINFEHNKVTALTASYGIGNASGLIKIDRTDTIGSTLVDDNKAKIILTSSSLYLNGTNADGGSLSIDLVWNTF